MAVLYADVIRGISIPLEELLISSIALAWGCAALVLIATCALMSGSTKVNAAARIIFLIKEVMAQMNPDRQAGMKSGL